MKQETSKTREHVRHIVRAHWIDLQLRNSRYPNARIIAEHFEVTEKTAQRTIDYMRNEMRLPLDYSPEHRGWYYTEPVVPMTAIELTEGELIAILITEKMARQYRGTPIGHQIEQAFSKIIEARTDKITIDLNALAEAYSFETSATSEFDEKVFAQLGRAINQQLSVEMDYYTASRNAMTHRRVDPLHLRSANGEWYLIAWDHLRSAPRDFHLGRIRELKVTEARYTWPPGVILHEYLNSGFGFIRGQEPIEVEIIFDEYQSRWIRERGKFHPTEEREVLPDGRVRLKMTVTALDGVKRFVLQYGSRVEVIKPDSLRQTIIDEIVKMKSIYQPSLGEQ